MLCYARLLYAIVCYCMLLYAIVCYCMLLYAIVCYCMLCYIKILWYVYRTYYSEQIHNDMRIKIPYPMDTSGTWGKLMKTCSYLSQNMYEAG